MVFLHFWVKKLNKKRKAHYILGFTAFFGHLKKKNNKNQLFLDFYITGKNRFAKNTLFGPKNGSIFPANHKTS